MPSDQLEGKLLGDMRSHIQYVSKNDQSKKGEETADRLPYQDLSKV